MANYWPVRQFFFVFIDETIISMKNITKLILILSIFLAACQNPFASSKKSESGQTPSTPNNEAQKNPNDPGSGGNSPKPDPSTGQTPTPSSKPIVHKRGDCGRDSVQLLSCLDCQISLQQIPLPLSEKAKNLLSILERGCAIKTKSDPEGYVPPTHNKLLALLNRADEAMYPSGTLTKDQKKWLSRWLSKDDKYLKEMFRGYWYNPPMTDIFETYFGIKTLEARYYFCYGDETESFTPTNETTIRSSDYIDCIYDYNEWTCREKPEFIIGNVYRKQLRQTIIKSQNLPLNYEELVPANKCSWLSMKGDYNSEMEDTVLGWKNSGYSVYVEKSGSNPYCQAVQMQDLKYGESISVVGKMCQDL